MKDPFPLGPIPWLARITQPGADFLSLPTLPLHVHEVFYACALYTAIYWPISPLISKLIVGERYSNLPRKRRVNWDAHVVSFVQSILINSLALWIMFADTDRNEMDQAARVWGYTGALGMIQALAAGYFLWDLIVTSCNMDVFGLGTLAHAISALVVYSFGFRPFVNYYAPTFILWELSTPFLNIHWFFDKLGLTGTKAQLYNGLLLIATFFSCRLVYGTYQSWAVMDDIWVAMGKTQDDEVPPPDFTAWAQEDAVRHATSIATVPAWLAVSYLASNIVLNGLNFYWFVMMIRAVRKRFQPAPSSVKELPHTDASSSKGSDVGAVSKSGTRRRKA